jgi:transposase
MIGRMKRPGKEISNGFAEAPWDQTSAEWRKIDEQLAVDHEARLIDRIVDRLDLTPLWESYGGRGSKACRPDLMLKMALFEIRRGRSSPAVWYRDAKENLALQWLGLGIQPSRSVWYEFASRIHRSLDGWNQEVLHQAQEQGQAVGRCVALDGTVVEANASRHRLLNCEQLQRRRQLLLEAVRVDEASGVLPQQPYWMAKTPPTRRWQSERYEVAQTKLEERLKENRRRVPSRRQEEKDIRISVSDPEAALGKDKHKVFRPLYNVQYVRDVDSPFILAYDTFARGSDTGTLAPMIARTQQLTGHRPQTALVDCGYITALDLADAQQLGVALYGPWKENDYSDKDAPSSKPLSKDKFHWDERQREYRCPQGQSLKLVGIQTRQRCLDRTEKLETYRANAATCATCPWKARCCPKSRSGRNLSRSEHEVLIEAHRCKMQTPEAKALYKLRAQTVETSFGDSKQHRNFRRINGRGLRKAKTHTALTVLAHNLRALAKATRAPNSSQQTN